MQEDPGQLLVIKAMDQVEALQRMGLPLSLAADPAAPVHAPLTVPFTHMVPQMVQYTHRQALWLHTASCMPHASLMLQLSAWACCSLSALPRQPHML